MYTVAARRPNPLRAAEPTEARPCWWSDRERGARGLEDRSDWPTLLKDYQAAVKNFESVSAAVTAMLSARYPLDTDFLDLVTVEERLRETVLLARIRLINRWRDSVEETNPIQSPPSPDHDDVS